MIKLSLRDTATRDDDIDLPCDAVLYVRIHGDTFDARAVAVDHDMLAELGIEALHCMHGIGGQALVDRIVRGAAHWVSRGVPHPPISVRRTTDLSAREDRV